MSVRNFVNSMQPNTAYASERLKTRQDGNKSLRHMMNEMLALLPTNSNKDDSLFLGLFLRKLPTQMRHHLAATDHQKADALARHVDILWDPRCAELSINTISDSIDIVSMASHDHRRSSPHRR